jgi:hypothetical protein
MKERVMKRVLLAMAIAGICFSAGNAQYPQVTIKQIQQVPLDSLLVADTLAGLSANANNARWTLQTSSYNNDTVTITAVCIAPAFVVTYTASGWTMVLNDTGPSAPWSGILVRANIADSTQLVADGFLSVAAGDVITMTGLVSEFPLTRGGSLTQFQPIAGQPIAIIGSAPVPRPLVKNVGDFFTGVYPAGKVWYSTGEPYEGMYVEFRNLTVNNKVNTTRGTFSAVDAFNNEISDYDWSHFFTLGHGISPADTTWQRMYASMGNGLRIDTLRGVISTSSGGESPRGYRICPLFPGDVVLSALPAPPLVSTHRRNPVVASQDSTPRISVKVTRQSNGAAPQTVNLKYSAGSGAFTTVPMLYQASDTTYVGSIPPQATGTFVRYFVQVVDSFAQVINLANSSTNSFSSDTASGFFFYNVIDRPLTIADVQYTPYVNGRSGALGAVTALSGIITADTAHMSLSPLNAIYGTNAWYMQSGTSPWSGIWLTPADSTAQAALAALRNGDSVRVTGTVQEQSDVTRLGNITQVQNLGSGRPEPLPVVRTTAAFIGGNGTATAEPYEGMLVRFNNVRVTNLNPTFSDPTEFAVSDGSGDVVVRRDGRMTYSNIGADTASGKTILGVGTTMTSLTGIIHYSVSQYKVVPRTNADLQGVVLTSVERVAGDAVPTAYGLSQNYPNPFNPSTVIEYSLPSAGFVSLKIFNLLGQEVRSLVNEMQSAGRYTARFDAAGLTTGLYFYRLQTGPFVEVRKMLLVK